MISLHAALLAGPVQKGLKVRSNVLHVEAMETFSVFRS